MSYEVLETQGDVVISFVLTCCGTIVDRSSPHTLTQTRANLVNNKHLADCGFRLGIEKQIKIQDDNVRQNEVALRRITSDVVEALMGAVWCDSRDMAVVHRVAHRILGLS